MRSITARVLAVLVLVVGAFESHAQTRRARPASSSPPASRGSSPSAASAASGDIQQLRQLNGVLTPGGPTIPPAIWSRLYLEGLAEMRLGRSAECAASLRAVADMQHRQAVRDENIARAATACHWTCPSNLAPIRSTPAAGQTAAIIQQCGAAAGQLGPIPHPERILPYEYVLLVGLLTDLRAAVSLGDPDHELVATVESRIPLIAAGLTLPDGSSAAPAP